jgi:hypothetical protein
MIKLKKYSIAYIPTKEVSYFCKNLVDVYGDSLIVKCKYDLEKDKWIPFEYIKDIILPDDIKTVFN